MGEFGRGESADRLRNGNLRFAHGDEFTTASLRHRFRQGGIRMTGEIEKRTSLSILFTHEKQWQTRPQEQDRCQRRPSFLGQKTEESFPMRAIADLIVVLKREHKIPGNQSTLGPAWVAAS